jgi:endonuclease G
MIYVLSNIKEDSWDSSGNETIKNNGVVLTTEKGSNVDANFYPESTTGQVVTHKHYTLSYNEEHEQAEWVAYKLTKENLRKPRVKRAKKFKQDDYVTTLSAKHSDYTHSGYTRGHLAPAGDMAFSTEAMSETFYMSNMSPQLKEFNGGIWRELEETVRDWAFDNDELYVVSGPILNKENIIKKIGHNKVSVPNQFYKIVLDLKEPELKSIAFLMPNEKSINPIKSYVVSIDQIEDITGIDFFAGFLSPELENKLEQIGNPNKWKFDNRKFKKRIEKWNNY